MGAGAFSVILDEFILAYQSVDGFGSVRFVHGRGGW